jgi:hypothetical protein
MRSRIAEVETRPPSEEGLLISRPIDLGTGLSCGGFNSLAAARQYAREENMVAWDIFHGNTLVERHVYVVRAFRTVGLAI